MLQQDWEEHMDLICTGQLARISAKQGTYLQIRPKAADSSSLMNTPSLSTSLNRRYSEKRLRSE